MYAAVAKQIICLLSRQLRGSFKSSLRNITIWAKKLNIIGRLDKVAIRLFEVRIRGVGLYAADDNSREFPLEGYFSAHLL